MICLPRDFPFSLDRGGNKTHRTLVSDAELALSLPYPGSTSAVCPHGPAGARHCPSAVPRSRTTILGSLRLPPFPSPLPGASRCRAPLPPAEPVPWWAFSWAGSRTPPWRGPSLPVLPVSVPVPPLPVPPARPYINTGSGPAPASGGGAAAARHGAGTERHRGSGTPGSLGKGCAAQVIVKRPSRGFTARDKTKCPFSPRPLGYRSRNTTQTQDQDSREKKCSTDEKQHHEN